MSGKNYISYGYENINAHMGPGIYPSFLTKVHFLEEDWVL